jgi:transketolase
MAEVKLDIAEYQKMESDIKRLTLENVELKSDIPKLIITKKVITAPEDVVNRHLSLRQTMSSLTPEVVLVNMEEGIKKYLPEIEENYRQAKLKLIKEKKEWSLAMDEVNKEAKDKKEYYEEAFKSRTSELDSLYSKKERIFKVKEQDYRKELDKQYSKKYKGLSNTVELLEVKLANKTKEVEEAQDDYNKLMEEYLDGNVIEGLKSTLKSCYAKIERLEKRPNIKLNWLTRLFIRYEG